MLELIRKYWLVIANASIVVLAIFDFVLSVGWLADYPAIYVGGISTLNALAGALGWGPPLASPIIPNTPISRKPLTLPAGEADIN